jgi:hypothetical protein
VSRLLFLEGTTWTQEIVWQLLRQKDGVQLAYADGNIDERFPMLEFNDPNVIVPTVNEIARRESPRLMKTHVPYNSIPEGFTRGLGKVAFVFLAYFPPISNNKLGMRLTTAF